MNKMLLRMLHAYICISSFTDVNIESGCDIVSMTTKFSVSCETTCKSNDIVWVSIFFKWELKNELQLCHIDGLVQDFSIPIASEMEILQSCTKPSIPSCDIT